MPQDRRERPRKSLPRTSTLKFGTIRHAPCGGGVKVARETSVSNVLSSVKRPIYFHLAPLVLARRSLSLSEQPSAVSFFLHRVPFSSYATEPLFSRSPFFNRPWYHLPPFNWDLPSRSNPPSLWPTRRCSASQPRPRCGNIARAGVLPALARSTWWRLWENSHAADDGAQPAATGTGNQFSRSNFLLSRSRRVSPTWRKTYH